MRRFYLLIFFLVQTAGLLAQKSDQHFVNLKELKPTESYDFFFEEVIDKTVPEDIGFALKGLSNRKVPAYFELGIEEQISKSMKEYLPSDSVKNPLVMIVYVVSVSEEIIAQSINGTAVVEIEIARRAEDKLLSLGIYESSVNLTNLDATGSHGKRIIQCFKNCILTFSTTDWKKPHSREINLDAIKYKYDYMQIPKKGAYFSFGNLARNEPVEDFEFTINSYGLPKNYTYILDYDSEQIRDDIKFISDGEAIYIYVGQRFQYPGYLKSQQVGRYIFFEVKGRDTYISAYFNLIGTKGLIQGGGLYLDTQTGALKGLTDYEVYQLTGKDYPEILKEYRRSKRKTENLELLIFRINQEIAYPEKEPFVFEE